MPYCEGQCSAIQTPPAPLQGVRQADIYACGGMEILIGEDRSQKVSTPSRSLLKWSRIERI